MVKSIEIKKISIREKLVVDVNVLMKDPRDYDFSPRASMEGSTISLFNEGEEASSASIELDSEQMQVAERDRALDLRVKFAVEGMHGILTHKTKQVMTGPNSKKLAEPRWKTVLPLKM
mgnify:FL=1